MKLRELVTDLSCDGATTLAVIGALGGAGILDAEVIGVPCKRCGGDGQIDSLSGKPFPSGYDVESALEVIPVQCPDCADAPVYVIAPEAMEAFVCATHPMLVKTDVKTRTEAALWFQTWSSGGFDNWWERATADCVVVLQALLPDARVAKEVVAGARGILDEDGAASRFYVAEDSEEASACDVAILEDKYE